MELPYAFERPLTTERLTLRTMTPDDAEAIHAYQSREDVCRYLLFEPRTLEQVREKVEKYSRAITLAAEGDFWQLAIEREGQVIGDLYFTIASAEHQTAEIGWTLHPDFQGQGYMTEAAAAIVKLAFEVLRLHRVTADLDGRNTASAALCERLGMRQEAYFVKDMWSKGEWTDTIIFALLAAEAVQD